MTVLGYQIVPLLRRTGREILDDGVPDLAAGTAYNFFLAIFPLLLFLAPLLSLIGDGERTMLTLLDTLGRSLPPAAFAVFRGVLEDVVFAKGAPGLMSLGAVGALWAGSNVFTTLIGALNRAFDVEETRPWWRRRLLAVIAAVVTGLVVLVTSIILVGGDLVARWFGAGSARAIAILEVPIAGLLLVALAWLNFSLLPNVRVRWPHALVGAGASVTLWMIVTLAFRTYVQHFGSYNATYGTIGGIILLLVWMYLSMLALLSGGELASELHHGTGALATAGAAIDPVTGRLGASPAFAVTSTDRLDRLDPLAPDSP